MIRLSPAIPMSTSAQKVNLMIDITCLPSRLHPVAFGQNCAAIITKIAELDTKVTSLDVDIFVKSVAFMKGNFLRENIWGSFFFMSNEIQNQVYIWEFKSCIYNFQIISMVCFNHVTSHHCLSSHSFNPSLSHHVTSALAQSPPNAPRCPKRQPRSPKSPYGHGGPRTYSNSRHGLK